jgi:hypothetical protein
MKISKLYDSLWKKIVIGLFSLGVYAGSIDNTEGFWPFYSKITGKNIGVQLAFYNEISKNAEFDGLQIGIYNESSGSNKGVTAGFTNHNFGNIEGLVIGVINRNDSTTDGASLGLFNVNARYFHGVSLGIINAPPFSNKDKGVVNGFQLGAYNVGQEGNYFQLGVINKSLNKYSLIVNSHTDDK